MMNVRTQRTEDRHRTAKLLPALSMSAVRNHPESIQTKRGMERGEYAVLGSL
jgi:hypothetical protein